MRRLRRSKGDASGALRDRERLLLEGPHLVHETLDQMQRRADLSLDVVLVTPDFRDSAEGRQLAPRLHRRPLALDPVLLEDLADADSPRGVIAIASRPTPTLAGLPRGPGIYVYADGIQNPGNLGALARVAEAAGARALLAGPGCCRLTHPRALRASAGSLLRLPSAAGLDVADVDHQLPAARWLTLVPRDGHDLYTADVPATAVLAVGGEGPGVGDALAARTDLPLTIPMATGVESLNATVATAVALFEFARRRR